MIYIICIDECTNFRNCDNCTSIDSCGWCGNGVGESFCTYGDITGPSINDTSCNWYYDDCPSNIHISSRIIFYKLLY